MGSRERGSGFGAKPLSTVGTLGENSYRKLSSLISLAVAICPKPVYSIKKSRFGLVRFGLVRFGLVRFGLVWLGLVQFGSVRFGSVRFGLAWFGSVRLGSVRFGSVWFGSVLFCSVRFGLVWFGYGVQEEQGGSTCS